MYSYFMCAYSEVGIGLYDDDMLCFMYAKPPKKRLDLYSPLPCCSIAIITLL